MPDLSILNTLIAMVIVILVLSLIVQSLQTLVKKFFKLKSRTILNSLEDLFETITRKPTAAATADPATSKTPQQLVTDVIDKLREMGRETLSGNPMLDSLAKGDLLKVLTRVEAEDLLPGAVGKFQSVLTAIGLLKAELASIDVKLLGGDASAKFAALQASLMPLIHDLEALAGGGNINPKVLLGDLYRLRQIKATDVFDILGQVQQKVGTDLEAAVAANDTAQKTLVDTQKTNDQEQIAAAQGRADTAASQLESVRGVSNGLMGIAQQLTALGTAFDAAFAPLRERLEQAEIWYDTVMQGFEERYTRHMRTVALIISIMVVVLLNANFFSVYRAMANPVNAENMADQTPVILKQSQQVTGGQNGATSTPPASPSPSPATNATPESSPSTSPTAAQTSTQGSTSTQPSPPATESPVAIDDLKKQREQAEDLIKTYKTFGIEPLTRKQLSNVIKGEVSAGDVAETLIGWAIMVMLLTAGAPFWQDTLESLFGLKNLLRQKSDMKNVEEGMGGQPKP